MSSRQGLLNRQTPQQSKFQQKRRDDALARQRSARQVLARRARDLEEEAHKENARQVGARHRGHVGSPPPSPSCGTHTRVDGEVSGISCTLITAPSRRELLTTATGNHVWHLPRLACARQASDAGSEGAGVRPARTESRPKPHEFWSSQLMHPEWLLDIPDTLSTDW